MEPIPVVTLLYDTVFIHAELVRRTDGRQAVDSHARCRVDVEDVCLARVGGEAGLIVVLGSASHDQIGDSVLLERRLTW